MTIILIPVSTVISKTEKKPHAHPLLKHKFSFVFRHGYDNTCFRTGNYLAVEEFNDTYYLTWTSLPTYEMGDEDVIKIFEKSSEVSS